MNDVNVATNETVGTREIEYIPFNKLMKGTRNVRNVAVNRVADKQLIANIKALGVLQNLVVEPSPSKDGLFEVIAGGRRWSSVGVLVKAGDLPDDYPLPCKIQTQGSVAATSLAENILRAPMSPADEFTAFASMRKQGMSDADIAEHFGVGKKHVLQRMKLAAVHSKILNAYRKGHIDLDTVMAFTLASSSKEQLAVFDELGHHCSDWEVRRHLTKEGETANGALAQFVTLAVYKAADGQVVTDLFGDNTYLLDDELLRRLAEEKLALNAAKLHKKEGWESVAVSLRRPDDFFQHHTIEPELVDAPSELVDALNTAVESHQAMEESEEEWTDEETAQFGALEDTIDALEKRLDGYREYSDEDKARSQCFVFIDYNGKAAIHRGLVSQAQRRATTHGDKQSEPGGATPSTAMPNALLQDLGRHRQHIAKAAIASNAALASDLLLYTLSQQILSRDYWGSGAIDAHFRHVMPDDEGIAESPAAALLEKARDALITEWLTAESANERFAALRQLKPKAKQQLLAYCVAECLSVGVATPGADDIGEAMLVDLAPDFAATWRPTGDNFFRRLTRDTLLAYGLEWLGPVWQLKHKKDKKKDLVALFDAFFNGDAPANLTPEQRDIREHWLPEGFVAESKDSSLP